MGGECSFPCSDHFTPGERDHHYPPERRLDVKRVDLDTETPKMY